MAQGGLLWRLRFVQDQLQVELMSLITDAMKLFYFISSAK